MPQTKDLADILRQQDPEKYKAIIARAEKNDYHDFKSEFALPKMELANDQAQFPELADIRQKVIDGEFDDAPNAEDKESLRQMHLDDDVPDQMFKTMGLEVPTMADRILHQKQRKKK